ncbi:glycosyltransferase family 4 protein [Pseudaminobacter sp. 19-2017]|uniref:Glycosyltransferase family 4 protein n=1 Tax=Pseudaminobacter soli (ex Zhang et al. 2022) TaxID=2831468 RepID=A0A942I992_9HYPH|nr:glycosyltransferase family 4 protein [Pseudaminobacter soli]MBS3650105.1 glycosyltransferase family 4 protein [Pseudaminobacter soli]
MKIAFYAPMKAPDHPVPSGDRLMARLLIEALRRVGHMVFVASELRGYGSSPDTFPERQAAGTAEAERLLTEWRGSGAPDLFFCYHPYYKAPDFLGPLLSSALAIPYVTAEASYSRRRGEGPWAHSQAVVEAGLRQAALNICFTQRDREGLRTVVAEERLAMLPPFIDCAAFTLARAGSFPPRLMTVAMMRPGDKLESYRFLARALRRCLDLPWTLFIVGDGAAGDEVRSLFADFPPDRVDWLGERPPKDLPRILAEGDLYVWPGIGEAFGLAYLEAQAAGLPVVAQAVAGVPEVVIDGATGILTREGDLDAYAAAIRRLHEQPDLRKTLREQARRFVFAERSLDRAADRLSALLARFEP